MPLPSGFFPHRVARGEPRGIYYGPGEWELLCDLLLGSYEFDVRDRDDESALDGHYRCLCACGESGSQRRVDSLDFRNSVDSMGTVHLGAGTGLARKND